MSKQDELAKFAADVEKAFLLVGGQQSKATYDWMIAKATEERIIAVLERNYGCDLFQVTGLEVEPCDSPHWVDTKLEDLIALIKGDVTERLQTEMTPNGYKGEQE